MALWDIRGRRLVGPCISSWAARLGRSPAYAGGVALGYQEPTELIQEVSALVELGYKAVKLRVGDSPGRDLARVAAVRSAFGPDLNILVDANTGFSVEDARQVMPGLEEYGVGWLEEPFPAHDYHSYSIASASAQCRWPPAKIITRALNSCE